MVLFTFVSVHRTKGLIMETTLIDPSHQRCSRWYNAAAAHLRGGHFVVIALGTSLPSGRAMVLRGLD
jgi:hypothetical protein